MRVLILTQSGGVGGIESSFVNFVRYASSQGHELSVVFWREEGPVRESLPATVRVIDIQTGLAGRLYRSGGWREALAVGDIRERLQVSGLILLRRVLRWARRPWLLLNSIDEEFDIAIAFRHEGYGPHYLVDSVKAHRKVMWFHHGSYSPGPFGRRVDHKYFKRMDQVVTVSEWARTVFSREFPDLAPTVTVVHNLVDAGEVRRLAHEPVGDIVSGIDVSLVTVSRLSAEKGVDIAVNVARILKDRGLNFIWRVIGEGPERAKLEALIEASSLEDVFVLSGERENPFPYVLGADIYVQTSRVEAYGLAIEEAMILGKPIVASGIPSAREILTDDYLGLTSSLEPEEFAERILVVAGRRDSFRLHSARPEWRSIDPDCRVPEIDEFLGS